MTPRFSIQASLVLLLLVQALATQAQDRSARTAGGVSGDAAGVSTTGVSTGVAAGASAGSGAKETAGPVLLELLEFIGEFTTEDGEWMDPAVLLEVDARELSNGSRREPAVLGAEGEAGAAAPPENCIATQCE